MNAKREGERRRYRRNETKRNDISPDSCWHHNRHKIPFILTDHRHDTTPLSFLIYHRYSGLHLDTLTIPTTMSSTTTTTTTTTTSSLTPTAAVSHPRITAENVTTLFPEVDTTLVRSLADTSTATTSNRGDTDTDLKGYDEEQIRLMDERCIVLDDDDQPIGSGSKKTCKYYNHKYNYSYCTHTPSSSRLAAKAIMSQAT